MSGAVAALAALPVVLYLLASKKAGAASLDVSRRMAEAIATGDPATVRTLAARLRIEGATEQAAELERVALVLAAKGGGAGAPPVVDLKAAPPVGPIVLNTKGIQQRLIALGYPLGSSGADGVMGPATMAAVKAFQAANGLAVDGIPGPATQAKLQDPKAKGPVAAVTAAPAAKPAPAPAAKPAPAPAPTKAAAPAPMTTKEIQLRLIALGYSVGSKGADGVMGTNTAAAVRLFQSVNGLTVDGVPGPATQAKLKDPTAKGPAAAVAAPAAAPAPAPAPAPKAAPAPAPAPVPAPVGGRAPTISAALSTTKVLLKDGSKTGYPSPNSSGQLVRDWQQVLRDLGFISTAPDGKFGPGTAAATKAFQTAANAAGAKSGKPTLVVDGIVGPATIARAKEARIMPSGPATFAGETFGDIEPLRVPPHPLPATPLPGLMPPMAPVDPEPRRALASRLYNMLELAPRGGEDRTLVARYQAQEGLKPTGYYGPATAMSLAQTYGIVPPKPLYWTESRTSKSKANYRDAMRMLGERDPQRSEEWNRAGAV